MKLMIQLFIVRVKHQYLIVLFLFFFLFLFFKSMHTLWIVYAYCMLKSERGFRVLLWSCSCFYVARRNLNFEFRDLIDKSPILAHWIG